MGPSKASFLYTRAIFHFHDCGQISIIPKPELRGFWGSSLIKPPFRVTSADVVIICPELWKEGVPCNISYDRWMIPRFFKQLSRDQFISVMNAVFGGWTKLPSYIGNYVISQGDIIVIKGLMKYPYMNKYKDYIRIMSLTSIWLVGYKDYM